ncbi:hypothetical protein [Aliamphritea hakodatensis]|uniref:hypothetical protein n=1 Tax=Aliamphritea hakodatensis TaxID=2895352 RepID=UPI0022FD7960|nr:hypothetical protein [Aliamphritea hakodatensis]
MYRLIATVLIVFAVSACSKTDPVITPQIKTLNDSSLINKTANQHLRKPFDLSEVIVVNYELKDSENRQVTSLKAVTLNSDNANTILTISADKQNLVIFSYKQDHSQAKLAEIPLTQPTPYTAEFDFLHDANLTRLNVQEVLRK